MNLIANTTSEKFLQAILAEQQKTNELLSELLCLMRKDTVKPIVTAESLFGKPKATNPKPGKPKRGNTNVSKSRSTSKGSASDSKPSGHGTGRSSERQTMSDS